MDKILCLASRHLSRTLIIFLGRIFPHFFLNHERIVRIIYSTQNINPKNNSLKSNFFRFIQNSKTGRNELSCSRFEFESLERYRALGIHFQDPFYKRNYYGLACTLVAYIKEIDGFRLWFTPIINQEPHNYFHCDICEVSAMAQTGVANPADSNYRIELLKERWLAHPDIGISFTKTTIVPPKRDSHTKSDGPHLT